MAKFITKLDVSPVPGPGRLWITDAPFVVESDIMGVIQIPAGFVFDGNSLPRVVWVESLPTDFLESGCVHDWLYKHNSNRKENDQVYREMLKVQGVGKFRRNFRYWVLRLAGGRAFKQDQAATLAASRKVA